MPQYSRKLKKGVRWFYKISFQGRVYRSQAIYHSKQEARKAEIFKYKELEHKARNINTNDDLSLLELINQRLDFIKASKTDKYYVENRYYLKILYEYFGNIQIKNISRNEIQELLIEQSKKLKSKNFDNYAVNAMIRIFKALFFYGIHTFDLDIKNPCIGINKFPIKKRIKYIPTDSEINDVLSKCDEKQKILLEFVRDTGCRISEALQLRHRDVFDGYVVLYTRKSKSGNLVPREAKFNTHKLTLPNSPDEKIFSFWKEAPRFLSNKTQGDWNWHNLRHRFASLLSQQNTPLFEIMNKLGHKNIETTQNYLQLLPKRSPKGHQK